MNNTTLHSFVVKRRGDYVYDIYVDKKHVSSKGSIESVLEELRILMAEDAEL